MRGCRLTKLVENFKFSKWKSIFQLEFLLLFEVPWAPLRFPIKTSSGKHILAGKHYARSGFAPSGQGSAVLIRGRSARSKKNVIFEGDSDEVRVRFVYGSQPSPAPTGPPLRVI